MEKKQWFHIRILKLENFTNYDYLNWLLLVQLVFVEFAFHMSWGEVQRFGFSYMQSTLCNQKLFRIKSYRISSSYFISNDKPIFTIVKSRYCIWLVVDLRKKSIKMCILFVVSLAWDAVITRLIFVLQKAGN